MALQGIPYLHLGGLCRPTDAPPESDPGAHSCSAEADHEIPLAAAKEVVGDAKKKRRPKGQKSVPADKLGLRLVKVLERYREGWNLNDLADFARHLREKADTLEMPERGGKKKTKG